MNTFSLSIPSNLASILFKLLITDWLNNWFAAGLGPDNPEVCGYDTVKKASKELSKSDRIDFNESLFTAGILGASPFITGPINILGVLINEFFPVLIWNSPLVLKRIKLSLDNIESFLLLNTNRSLSIKICFPTNKSSYINSVAIVYIIK